MDKIIEKSVAFILKYRLFLIIFILTSAFFALAFIPKIKLDNSVEAFFDKKSESYVNFQKWKDQFGNDQVIILAFRDEDIFTEANLKLISILTERFEALEYVHEVESLASVNDIAGSESDFIVKKFIEKVPAEPEELKKLKEEALSNPLYVKNLISEDGKTAAIIVELENRPKSGDAYKRETTEDIFRIAKEVFPEGREYHISGPTAMEYFYTLYMRDDLKIFLPVVFAVIIFILALSFKTIEGVALPFVAISATLIFTMFFLYLLGFSINNITTIIPPIILAIVVADIVHFVGKIAKRKELIGTVKELAVPCLLTTLTTAAGFLSLTVTRLSPIREIGLVVGAGVLFAFVLTFTLIPALIKQFNIFKPSPKPEPYILSRAFDGYMVRLSGFIARFTNTILIVTLGILFVSFWGITRIQVDTNILDYFKKKTPIYKSTKFIDTKLSGTNFLEISLKADERDYFKEPEALQEIVKLQSFLEEIPEADKATSVAEYIKEINKSFHNENPDYYAIPGSRNLVSQYLLLYGATDLHDFVDTEWKWAAVQVRLNEHSDVAIKGVLSRIEGYLKDNFHLSVQKELLGWPILGLQTNDMITQGQLRSLSLAMLIIFAMMFVVFRSFSLGFISIVPNALPILMNFGIMGIFGFKLDGATSMISAIGIGIIVDDTIHFMHSFKEEIKKDRDYALAIQRVLLNKGRPIIMTSVILFFGFGIVVFSNFMTTVKFGVLTALMMFTALLADLIILPSLLLFFKPKPR